MSQLPVPDDYFVKEFGDGQLGSRLWMGGLRADHNGYSVCNGIRALVLSLRDGLDISISDGTVENIVNDIETRWNDLDQMRRACNPISGFSSGNTPLSASLAKVFLSIDLFQTAMVTCIVNKISELGQDSSPENDMSKILLNQLRWLDFIVDGPAMCESLLSILPVLSGTMQKTLVESLPEVLDDSCREGAVTELVRVLEESPAMVGSVVDALGALGVDHDRLPDVNTSILSTLSAANRDVQPALLKYLLRTCPTPLLTETVKSLRSTLALPGLGPASGKLCLDAVKAGLRMSKTVADHVIKTLRAVDDPSDHRPADFWLLLALLDSPLHRKTAEILFRKKAASGVFTKSIMDAALAPFADAFHPVTDRLIRMASVAVKSPEVGARRTGVVLYALVFALFSTGNTRRNVITALLEHTGTRRAIEINAALESLAIISREAEEQRSLLPHSASIQGLLDFLEFFNDSQLRQIWTILGYLCRSASNNPHGHKPGSHSGRRGSSQSVQDVATQEEDGEADLAMLEILLRKELTHAETFYRRIGVIGACTMVKVLGNAVKNNILNMLLEVGRLHPLSQSLAFDELAQVFCDGDTTAKDTVEFIRKTISTLFEKKYITDRSDADATVKDEILLPAELYGNLEGDDIEFCFSISRLIRNEATLKGSQDSVRAMVPNLRLLCVLTASRYDQSLSEVDAIIGAPLHLPLLPKGADLDDVPGRAKCDLLLSLFIAHGWVVELINGFARQESAELRAKCVMRVDNLLELNIWITSLIPKVPNWSEVLFDMYTGTRGVFDTRNSILNNGGRPSTGSRRRGALKEKLVGPSVRAIEEWKNYARKLNPSALSLIRITSPVSWRFTETESEMLREGNPAMQSAILSSQALQFLLSELFSYLDGLIGGNFKNPNAFGVSMFRSTGNQRKPDVQSPLSAATTDGLFKSMSSLRTALTSLGLQLSRCFRSIFPDEGNGSDDGSDGSSVDMLKDCAMLCLKSLTVTLNSSILSDSISQRLLFATLACVRLDGEPIIEASDPFMPEDVHAAAKVAFEQIRIVLTEILSDEGMEDEDNEEMRGASIMELEGCSSMLATMDSIYVHCSDNAKETLGPMFSKTAHSLLAHSWDAATLRSRKTQKLIPGIVKIYVQCAKDSMGVLEDLRSQVLSLSEKQAELGIKKIDTQVHDGEGSQDGKLGSLQEQTVCAYTIAVLEQYMWLFKAYRPGSFERAEDALTRMTSFIKAEQPLYNLARHNQRMLGPVMRAGRAFVDIFMKVCLPYLKDNFQEQRSMVVQICKMHQKPTRILQTFCAHSKFIRDTSLTGLVPPLRKSLELLLYRVKDLLQSNSAMDAFQMGNLKHRDINGEVLSSQHLQYKSESDPGSEYSTAEETDDDGDEKETRITNRNKSQRSKVPSQAGKGKQNSRKNLSRLLPPKKKRKTVSKRGNGKLQKQAQLNAQELDLGSDDDESDEEQPSRVRRKKVMGSDDNGSRTTSRRSSKKKKSVRHEHDEENERRVVRNALIDDEAAHEEEEGMEDDEQEDLSQFIVFGDEEEEEEEE